jgi:RNA polymerase sigma-70 factor (ECF subfamily)
VTATSTEIATDGDVGCLARRLDAYRSELRAHCRRIVGPGDAEDAVQETMIRAWQSFGRFEHRSSLRTWLYRIATNVCIDHVRGREHRPVPVDVAEVTPAPPPTQAPVPGPEDVAVTDESVRRALLAAVTHLPPRQRAALVLYDVFRWPVHDVAALMGTTPASVTSAVQRARATLARPRGDRRPSAAEGRLIDHYVDAFSRYDLAALVTAERVVG